MLYRLALTLLVTALGSRAVAEPTAKDILDAKPSDKVVYTSYMLGLLTGFEWMNDAKDPLRPLRYCQPEKLALTPDQANQIMRSYLASRGSDDYQNFPVGIVLLKALEDTFPCSTRP